MCSCHSAVLVPRTCSWVEHEQAPLVFVAVLLRVFVPLSGLRDEHHSPAMSTATRSTRGTRRAITNEPGFVSRVFVVVVSSVVCLGLLQKRQTTAGTVVGNKYTRHSGLLYCSVRDLPWADPPLPGTKRSNGVRAHVVKIRQFAGLGLL